ncbi:hypothetical protein TOL_0347 [Thalassolituus oleivorans MIL-1]|uniref:Uncharacterized protein n=1 Tax=Thalassolituus oleivorans MIL-1 TaxID=1298593 RepID=M5DLU1_9GAMM|nr:hypothetical protein TOL_0347 [Thalassolituus oleivorans MIL-1]
MATGENVVPEETEEVPFFFPEDDEDEAPIVNPADAYKEQDCALSANGRKDAHRLSKVPETFCISAWPQCSG